MRRPALTVDTRAPTAANARDSLQPPPAATPTTLRPSNDLKRVSAADSVASSTSSAASAAAGRSAWSAPNPTVRLLFSFLPRRHVFVLVIPAIIASFAAAAVPVLMTIVMGLTFDAYAAFPPFGDFTQDQARQLLRSVGIAALELLALAIGAVVLSGVMAALWVWVGESNVLGLRRAVFDAVASREMQWFDTKSASDSSAPDEAVGAGGLMAQFARDSDSVREASGQNMGLVVQHTATILATIIISFVRAPTLAAVTLAVIPVTFITQVVMQVRSGMFLNAERQQNTAASNILDRALNAIPTVKSFNAQSFEFNRANHALAQLRKATLALITHYAISTGTSSFLIFAMFVVAFWYGAKLAADGSVSPGDVITVFWACLMTASTLGQLIPTLICYSQGTNAMVALMNIIDPPPSETSQSPHLAIARTPKSAFFNRGSALVKQIPLQKIKPSTCNGEFSISNMTFAYPSRINMPVLSEVSLFIPSGEMTFIVGGSGSGKSTLAQILLRLYDIQAGSIELDGQSFYHLDEKWVRSHVAAVQQGCILFDGTVHENVAMGLAGSLSGRKPSEATREEVMAACRIALMHDFIRDLPNGYDTVLGTGGANLSGGQKQRLAIARAVMRDPTVLILDEATSALDGTSRLLVFEAIKAWRKNKTTIVITHDLSQITGDDFIYLLRDGRIEEQGFRHDLEQMTESGQFYSMMVEQGQTGGFLPAKDTSAAEAEQALEREAFLEYAEEQQTSLRRKTTANKHRSTLMPRSFLDPPSLDDLTRESPMPWASRPTSPAPPPPMSTSVFQEARISTTVRPRRSSLNLAIPGSSEQRSDKARKHASLPFTPLSPSFSDDAARQSIMGDSTTSSFVQNLTPSPQNVESDDEFEEEKEAMKLSAAEASGRRLRKSQRKRWEEPAPRMSIEANQHGARLRKRRTGDLEKVHVETPASERPPPQLSFFGLVRIFWPVFPSKVLFVFSILAAFASGAITPVFAYLITQLQTAVTAGQNQDESRTLKFAILVLVIAVANGITSGVQYYMSERCGANWVRGLQKRAFERILQQDKAWFDSDKEKNAPADLLQYLMKDTDDSRSLVAWIAPKATVVTAMIGVGLVWALVRGWQLTLAGLALGPLFAVLVALNAKLVAKHERRNKLAREDVNSKYYNVVANLRAIRSMTLESVFKEEFEKSLLKAQSTGVSGGFIDGLGLGIVNGLIYFSQAVLFYLGAVFMSKGIYTFQHFLEVFNLIVITTAFAGQLFTFVERIAKAKQSTFDLKRLVFLDVQHTTESKGKSRYPLQGGSIKFSNVSFAYPSRPDVQVFRGLSFKVKADECVAIVGASGIGKSTTASLLQRLYEPTSGAITIRNQRLDEMDVHWLRQHIAVVSQQPYMFDASVADNITYGLPYKVSQEEIERAARAANIHDFILSLPEGYNTFVGANASQISGGQAQRIQIARALVRKSSILILDECTSALDPTNQNAVMTAIEKAKVGRTTLVITHKLPLMRMADRILVLDEGQVVEDGQYEELMSKKGQFWKLATAGEWEGDH